MVFTFEKIIRITDSANLHVVELKDINEDLEKYIDSKMVTIARGSRIVELEVQKNKLSRFLNTKSNKIKMGAIAEFLTHLYISTLNYKQEFLFSNLEERSIKKGFDGLYSFNNIIWLMESKSGSIGSEKISHIGKIQEAYNDLKSKLSGGGSEEAINNPWENAYYHATIKDVSAHIDIVGRVQLLSDNFDKNIYSDIKDFNVMPSATIFLNGAWEEQDYELLESKIKELVVKLNYNKLEIICFTKMSLQIFIDYLNKGNLKCKS